MNLHRSSHFSTPFWWPRTAHHVAMPWHEALGELCRRNARPWKLHDKWFLWTVFFYGTLLVIYMHILYVYIYIFIYIYIYMYKYIWMIYLHIISEPVDIQCGCVYMIQVRGSTDPPQWYGSPRPGPWIQILVLFATFQSSSFQFSPYLHHRREGGREGRAREVPLQGCEMCSCIQLLLESCYQMVWATVKQQLNIYSDVPHTGEKMTKTTPTSTAGRGGRQHPQQGQPHGEWGDHDHGCGGPWPWVGGSPET